MLLKIKDETLKFQYRISKELFLVSHTLERERERKCVSVSMNG